MDSFDFHYNQFKQAGARLANPEGLTVEDFKMWDTTREASATAIALEAGIIDHIPADGRLGKHNWQAVQLLIRRYEISNQEEEIQQTLDPNWMYDALDEGLAA